MLLPVLLIVAAGAAALAAGDANPATQARAAWRAAQRAGDAWTCLQLEAWGRAQQPVVAMGPILGQSAIFGSPLATFPGRIVAYRDLGERIVVIAAQRAWQLAPDGRPFQPSLLLPRGEPTLSANGAFVFSIAAEQSPWRATLTRLSDGKALWSVEIPAAAGMQRLGRAIADDGSAVALGLSIPVPNGPAKEQVLVFTGHGKPQEFELRAQPVAVGPRGAWLISGGGNEFTAIAKERRLVARSVAAGSSQAVVLSDSKLWHLAADGSVRELPEVPPLGQDPRLVSVGEWLVLATGHGATAPAGEDLLGEGGGPTMLPPRLALWRWAELPGREQGPQALVAGRFSLDRAHPAALWLWEGAKVERLDLSGAQPRRETVIADAGAPVGWMENDGPLIRLHFADFVVAYYDAEGRELWRGQAQGVRAWRHDLATIERREGERARYLLLRLAADPAARREVALELPPQRMAMRVPLLQPDAVIASNDGGRWWIFGLDGALQQARPPDQGIPLPPLVGMAPSWPHQAPPGRWVAVGARLLPARAPAAWAPALPSGEDLVDAWRNEAGTWLLDRSGRLALLPATKGEPRIQAAPPHASFVLLDKDLALFAPGQPLWRIGREPPYTLEAVAGPPQWLPAGPWKVDKLRFGVPHGKQLDWDEERLGWRPERLRSPAKSGLFVITPALLIEVQGADAARCFGK